jgi:hypothetical protein
MYDDYDYFYDYDGSAANCRHYEATHPPLPSPSCNISVVCDDSACMTKSNSSPSEGWRAPLGVSRVG